METTENKIECLACKDKFSKRQMLKKSDFPDHLFCPGCGLGAHVDKLNFVGQKQ